MSVAYERKEERLRYHADVQFQVLGSESTDSVPFIADGLNISASGIGFVAPIKIDYNSSVIVSIAVGEDERLFLTGRVVRVVVDQNHSGFYNTGVYLENNSKESLDSFSAYLKRINIFNILSQIDLKDVVDINFLVGYSPVIKKMNGLEISSHAIYDAETLKVMLLATLDDEATNKFMKEKEANFILPHRSGNRFRVNLHFQRGNIEAVLRVIPPQIKLPRELGLPASVQGLVEMKKGLILIAGRAGSGKSTTLASMVEFLNNETQGVIISIEDPIEFVYKNKHCIIKQREVGKDTLSFYNGTKNSLKQNPDVLVIGELDDAQTIDLAVAAAETGALVIATVNAGDCVSAIERVISSQGHDSSNTMAPRLSKVLNGIVSQQLVSRVDGCGAVLATELLFANRAVKTAIKNKEYNSIRSIIENDQSFGMQSMERSLEILYRSNLISPDYLEEKEWQK